MCASHNWLCKPPKWTKEDLNFVKVSTTRRTVNLENVVKTSERFGMEFPLKSIRNKTLLSVVPKQMLVRNVQSAYPIIHEAVLHLCVKFLQLKLKHGTKIEKELYSNMTAIDFLQRLLTKRTIMFIGQKDNYILRNGFTGTEFWDTIGTETQNFPLILQEYLSYDELKLSALLSTSSYSYFINSGSRFNRGLATDNRGEIQPEGIVISLVGPRLNKPKQMEFQEIIITPKQNTVINGYGDCNLPNIHNLFSIFYETNSSLYENIRYGPINDILRYRGLQNGYIFDNIVYGKRLAVILDTLLIEANYRALKSGLLAYVHVMGIGLGTWKISDHQEDVFVETIGNRLSALGSQLNYISDIHLSYFERTIHCHGYTDGELFNIPGHPNGGIKIHISEREPFSTLKDPGKLLIVSYASDSNAIPGNEFWDNKLENSSNSAIASSSQISENHNPLINHMICAENLMVVMGNCLLLTIQEYFEKICAISQ